MNSPDPEFPVIPAGFNVRYVIRLSFWIGCRWIWKNPLTILLGFEDIALQLVADHPTWRVLGTAAGFIGMLIAQVRNRGIDYTVPVAQSSRDQAKAVLVANPPSLPAVPAPKESPK